MAMVDGQEKDAITTYSMHVSAKYLELTKKKLELTRLPRELELPEQKQWDHGVPKTVLEPLLDYWLDGYDWRRAEAKFNLDLPQFRTTITTPLISNPSTSESLRIHFVHKRSRHTNAIPLLFCHTWPSSFIEVQRIIDALTDPLSLPSMGHGAQQAFHVIAPSIPGFGFSEGSASDEFGLKGTGDVFHGLMSRLGYDRYVTHGTGWGFNVCRALAIHHPKHCVAVHVANPSFSEPAFKRGPLAYMKYHLAKVTKARIPLLSFGYTPTEMQALQARSEARTRGEIPMAMSTQEDSQTLHSLYALRPQTAAFSLCDSPVGLLAALLDVIHTRVSNTSPPASRSRSPFLSPVELEMQDAESEHIEHDRTRMSNGNGSIRPFSSQQEQHSRSYTWAPTEVLNFTMLQWLPGPEAALRWLRRAHLETRSPQYNDFCPVPLGVSSFTARSSSSSIPAPPLQWGSAAWNLVWVKRHQRNSPLPAWEAPDVLVLDLRECFGSMVAEGRVCTVEAVNLPSAAS